MATQTKSVKRATKADFHVECCGNLFAFRPQNKKARKHIEDNTSEEAQWFCGALMVEHGYARVLATALQDKGFIVQ